MLTGTLITGLGLGSMYGLVALGFHVTYAVSSTVNFAQGSAVTLGAVLGYTLAVTLGWPMPAAILGALLGCALLGVTVERLLVRPFVEKGSDAWLLATVAGGIVLDNAMLFTFGKEPRSLPSPLATTPVAILGTGIYPLQLVIPVVGIALAFAIRTVFRRTDLGRVLLAVAQNADAARLMGIDVRRTVACAFALSAVLAGIAHILSILFMPALAERNAYARLEEEVELNTMTLLPDPTPRGAILPMMGSSRAGLRPDTYWGVTVVSSMTTRWPRI